MARLKRTNELHLKLSDPEMQMVTDIAETIGTTNQDVIRNAIREFYFKSSTKAKTGSLKLGGTNATPEEQCLLRGGQVIERGGAKFCHIVNGGIEITDPL